MGGGIRETLARFDALCAASDPAARARLLKALEVIQRAADIFGLEGVCFSFNGGKDSTVVLHLLRLAVAQRALAEAAAADAPLSDAELEARTRELLGHVPVMYFDSHDQFPEVRAFIERCVSDLALSCHVYKCSFVEGVQDVLDKLRIKGIYMGVRGGDPHTEDLEHFSPSTPGWPAFLRINPILRWTYADVWTFLRECRLEYCELYDHGCECVSI